MRSLPGTRFWDRTGPGRQRSAGYPRSRFLRPWIRVSPSLPREKQLLWGGASDPLGLLHPRQEPHLGDLFVRHVDFGGKYLQIVTLHNCGQMTRSSHLFGDRE